MQVMTRLRQTQLNGDSGRMRAPRKSGGRFLAIINSPAIAYEGRGRKIIAIGKCKGDLTTLT